ncbi:hypothetical protein V8B97DRAFT_1984506 [Scleroderma yunnanense]
MPAVGDPGEPREGNKPEPIGSFLLVVLLTICTSCLLYILWRRASSLRTVVSHQLKTWTTDEGRIRLSEDDGPAATEFLSDADDETPVRLDRADFIPPQVQGQVPSSRAETACYPPGGQSKPTSHDETQPATGT